MREVELAEEDTEGRVIVLAGVHEEMLDRWSGHRIDGTMKGRRLDELRPRTDHGEYPNR